MAATFQTAVFQNAKRPPPLWKSVEGRLLYGGWLSGDMLDMGQCHNNKTARRSSKGFFTLLLTLLIFFWFLPYMGFGRIWAHGKYFYGVCRWFAYNSGHCINPVRFANHGQCGANDEYQRKFYLPSTTPPYQPKAGLVLHSPDLLVCSFWDEGTERDWERKSAC